MSEDVDPSPGKRVYVRHTQTGDMGWLVIRAGKECVKYDRGAQDIVVPYTSAWDQVIEHRPCSHAQIVRVAFEADKALLPLLGMHGPLTKRDWIDLTDKQRIAWLEDGPSDPPIRRLLYATIMDALSEHMVDSAPRGNT